MQKKTEGYNIHNELKQKKNWNYFGELRGFEVHQNTNEKSNRKENKLGQFGIVVSDFLWTTVLVCVLVRLLVAVYIFT